MIGVYLSGAFAIVAGLFFAKGKYLVYSLLWLFIGLQATMTAYAFYRQGSDELIYFSFDPLAILLLAALTIISVPAAIHSTIYIESHHESSRARSAYLSSLVLLITAIGAGYMSNHIAVLWIFTELTTLSASAIIYHHRNKAALEATWKYVFICAISITFIFIGILFLSLSLRHAGSDDLSFANLMANSDSLNPFWLRLAFLFIFTGFTAKLGLVPMFTAGIDAKDSAPAPAGALLASVLMNLGFVGVFRLYAVMAQTPSFDWARMVVTLSAFLSLFVAAVYMLKVKNIKRMFAFSGIEHMALVMLGVAAGGIGYYAAVLHIILHGFVKSSLFFQFSQFYKIFRSKSIYQAGNYFSYNTTGATVMLLGFVFAAAIPPSGLFVSEFLIFTAMFDAGQVLLLVAVLAILTMILWAFGKNMFRILFLPAVGFDDANLPGISPWESATQYLLLALSVYLGLNPPGAFVELIEQSVAMFTA